MEHLRTKKEILEEFKVEYDRYLSRMLKVMKNREIMEKDCFERFFILDSILKNMYSKESTLDLLNNAIITNEVENGWVWVEGWKLIGEDKRNCFTTNRKDNPEGKKTYDFDYSELGKCHVHKEEVDTGKSGFHLVLNIQDIDKFASRIFGIKMETHIYKDNFYNVIALVKIDDLFNYAFF